MHQYFNVPDEVIEEARRVYRETGSMVAVVRHIRASSPNPMYWDGVVIAVDAFGVSLSFTQWLNYWRDDPEPGQYSLTDEELDAKMCPLIEKNRHLWDNPAASDGER